MAEEKQGIQIDILFVIKYLLLPEINYLKKKKRKQKKSVTNSLPSIFPIKFYPPNNSLVTFVDLYYHDYNYKLSNNFVFWNETMFNVYFSFCLFAS